MFIMHFMPQRDIIRLVLASNSDISRLFLTSQDDFTYSLLN